MLKIHIAFLLIVSSFLLSAQNSNGVFKTDVETDKKPWTNLDFNNNPNNIQFAIMADRTGGMRPGIFKEAVEKINTIVPEFVICIGDLIPGATSDTAKINEEWNEINTSIEELKMPFFYLPGNHDIANKVMAKEWEKRYGKRYYNFIYKNTLFVILDTNDDDEFNLTREQTDFVTTSLKENSDVRWTFILMHHPLWTYETGGRFEEIEKALNGRKHTVFAGHAHRYHQTKRNGANYYILSTTGGGNALTGEKFGLFDHISWVTLTDNGPVLANLKLYGILAHDIANNKTKALTNPMLSNARLNHLLLCNKGKKFKHGTLYFLLKNPTEEKLEFELNFFHHQQLKLENTDIKVIVDTNENKVIEIPFSVSKPLGYNLIDSLNFNWNINYINQEYLGIKMQGKQQISIKPTKSEFITNEINTFLEKDTVQFINQFPELEAWFIENNSSEKKYNKSIEIEDTNEFSFYLKNSKKEYSSLETRLFEKTNFLEAKAVTPTLAGLKYKYYEGEWNSMPDFETLKPKSEGIASDFLVRDIALREDNWGLVYTGYMKIKHDNLYQIRVRAEDDIAHLYIDNKLVADENTIIKGENIAGIALKKGYHAIRIEFWEKQNGQRLRFYTRTSTNEGWDFMEFSPFFH